MDIIFRGPKYKSITPFEWKNIPNFAIITGPNGSGKSQLLELIYNSIINKTGTIERVEINEKINSNEITYLRGEWDLQNTSEVNLSKIQMSLDQQFQNLKSNLNRGIILNEADARRQALISYILIKTGKKTINELTVDEFSKYIPEIFIEQENQLSQKIGELFYNYRLSEIEKLAEGLTPEEIIQSLGQKPWIILREIINESKLPFEINDPSKHGFKDSFQLKLRNTILNEEVNFSDLSSGEKVLISLMFYLYNSQEKNIFPKFLLMDEPDAHLHPSMSQQFLNVVKNVLVDKYNVKVIMTTHSPSTVILAPSESIYEMSRSEPRIKLSHSKNHSVSLLTAGLVYVGEGTKYFLVEDVEDVNFYSYIYNQLTSNNQINADIPLVFIPASTKDKSGGKDVVQNWVKKLQESGLVNVVNGLIDEDSGNIVSNGVFKIDRYSIENYVADPLIVFATLLDKEKAPNIDGINLNIGEEYKIKTYPNQLLQKIIDEIISLAKPKLTTIFPNFNSSDEEIIEIELITGQKVFYPKWLLKRRGKTIIQELYNQIFGIKDINYKTLFKTMKKLNMFPIDLVNKFSEIKKI